MERARVCLKLYFDPDMSDLDRAEMYEAFGRVLGNLPRWAVSKGYDAWEKSGTRRPSPAEILILAERAIKELTDEVARRGAAKQSEPDRECERVSPSVAAEILASAGFGEDRTNLVKRFPMAGSVDEVHQAAKPSPHWSETAAPNDPRWEALRKSRKSSQFSAK
ncbi:MAG: hypothetical protein U5N55_03570, partial [Cypionkella sp.]|nr:hypothetical protein [Cypionkella sp.]